jgi:hypothetical protein
MLTISVPLMTINIGTMSLMVGMGSIIQSNGVNIITLSLHFGHYFSLITYETLGLS